MFERIAARLRPASSAREDLEYEIGGVRIRLPAGHRLPEYQSSHPWYDRFLPHFVSHLPPGTTVIDVGANCGDTLAAMASTRPDASYVCIEPDETFTSYLRENVARLQRAHAGLQVRSIPALVGKDVAGASLLGAGGTKHAVAGNAIKSVTLDSLVDAQTQVSLLKSDVDGFDYDVLRSAEQLLRAQHPILFFECFCETPEQEDGYASCFEWLSSLGYARWVVFDNFGQVISARATAEQVRDWADYVWRQARMPSTRTIYYLDLLCCCEADEAMIHAALASYGPFAH